MCDANAYLIGDDGTEEVVLESVDLVELDGDQAILTNIFGEQRVLKARLRRFDNSQGRLLFEPV